ncbi:MAG: hypothetical protein Q4D62_08150, partial [Planctomycetia bacterium]|nr:hypothetical protein [Planctomycetia bacterium]
KGGAFVRKTGNFKEHWYSSVGEFPQKMEMTAEIRRGTALAGGGLEVERFFPVPKHPVCLSAVTPLKERGMKGAES